VLRFDAATDQALLAAAWWQIGASIAAIVLALLGIALAYRAAADQRANRAFPSDRAHAEEFAKATKEITGAGILASKFERQSWFGALQQARARYNETVSNAEAAFGTYFTKIEGEILALAEREEQGNATIPRQTAETLIDFNLDRIRDNARNWVYPEQRVSILTNMLEQQLAARESESPSGITNRRLSLKRSLIVADPSYYNGFQRMRLSWNSLQFFVDDLFHGRMPARRRKKRAERNVRKQIAQGK
jgi:hypothetical protein